MPSSISLDYETYGEVQLSGPKSVGVHNYSTDLATEALMVAYRIDDQDPKHVDLTEDSLPREVADALTDPHVLKWAFNATFERMITRHVLGLDTPIAGWRCSLALAHLQSFNGDLLQIGKAMGVPESEIKDKEGDRLIKLFAVPQKITRKNSLYRRNNRTDPDDWQAFCDYNIKDEVAETSIRRKLLRFHVPEIEWRLYELDQEINDRGLYVNVDFVRQAVQLTTIRRRELVEIMRIKTGLRNPNSGAQLLPWLRQRGYPFSDLQKATVKKVLAEHKAAVALIDEEAVGVLKLRQNASRTSPAKYDAMLRRVSADGRLRHCFQFAGAARTARWAGRGPQPHNLTRTPPQLEADGHDASKLEAVAEIIESGDYDTLKMMMAEPMDALAGSVRSSFQSEPGNEFIVCDLSAIESAVSAWLFNCVRLLRVFRDGLDPYKDFGVELYHKPYADITKPERTICKPAVLGCTYQLGGGELRDGKRTGLWGYAENMGVDITRDEAHRQVRLYREIYKEIPEGWRALENAARSAVRGQPTTVSGKLHFEMQRKYLTITLPSGRPMYYYKPQFMDKTFVGKDGEEYTRNVLTYMGSIQGRHAWGRISTSGGKLMENVVQATSRDVLGVGMLRAKAEGFPIVGSVHDEIITEVRRGSNFLNYDLLRESMKAPIPWAKGLPLGAAGYVAQIYRKD